MNKVSIMKKAIAVVILISLVFGIASCGNSSIKEFAGTWRTTEEFYKEVTINEDGSYEWTLHTVLGDTSEKGIVEVNKSKRLIDFYIDEGNGIDKGDWTNTLEFTYFLSGNTLYLYKKAIQEEPWYTFRKQSDTAQSDPAGETTNIGESMSAPSDTPYGSLFQLMSGVIGKDKTEAEKMIGEHFGVAAGDMYGHQLENTINGIPTILNGYILLLTKDSFRYNSLTIWTDPDKDTVRCIELELTNIGSTSVDIGDTPQTREEIKKQYDSTKQELDNAYGEAYKTDNPQFDEDSFCFFYNVSSGCKAYIEIRDFTQEGGNGLLKTKLLFADDDKLLLY